MYPTKPNNTNQKVAAGTIVLVVIALLAVGVTVYNGEHQGGTATRSIPTTTTATSTPQAATANNTPSNSSAGSSQSNYKDGTYTASSDYYVPHGSETIQITLTIKNGVVSDSQIQNSEGDRESAQFQEDFALEYKSQVVGKNISGLQLSYVAGASDTTQGFNDAVAKIRSQAQA